MQCAMQHKTENQFQPVDFIEYLSDGFSGTLFRHKTTNEYVLSIRSTEFIDDAIRDSSSTNEKEVHDTGWAWGQISDMEAWYASIKSQIDGPLNVTGYSLGGHLATAFNLLHNAELMANGGQVYTFNGAGVGGIKSGTLQEVLDYFNLLRNSEDARKAELNLEEQESRDYYAKLIQNLNNTWDAQKALQELQAVKTSVIILGNESELAHRERITKELQPLETALKVIVELQTDAARIQGFTSGVTPNQGDTPIKVVPHGEIDAMTLGYRLAIYFASQRTIGADLINDLDNLDQKKPGDLMVITNQYELVGKETTGLMSWSAVANSQYHYGENADIFIEDQPFTRGSFLSGVLYDLLGGKVNLLRDQFKLNNFGDTHSLTLIIDSLNVQNTLLNLLPEDQRNTPAMQETMKQILKNASNLKADSVSGAQGQAEGDPLENLLNALGTQLLGPAAWKALRGDVANDGHWRQAA